MLTRVIHSEFEAKVSDFLPFSMDVNFVPIVKMYQPHETTWCFFTFLLLLALAGVMFYLRKEKKPAIPRWVPPALAVLAALQIACAGIIRICDERELRNELRHLPRSNITKLVLARSGVSREIADPQQIAALMSLVQSARYVGAHHSYPKDLVELIIESGGNSYHYQVGRDSDRPDEYWILERGRSVGTLGREIGRVQTPQLGPMLDRLLEQKP